MSLHNHRNLLMNSNYMMSCIMNFDFLLVRQYVFFIYQPSIWYHHGDDFSSFLQNWLLKNEELIEGNNILNILLTVPIEEEPFENDLKYLLTQLTSMVNIYRGLDSIFLFHNKHLEWNELISKYILSILRKPFFNRSYLSPSCIWQDLKYLYF